MRESPAVQSGEDPNKRTAWTSPSISLPKGGGAIRGMGEKFGANPVTGTGSMTIPIATSPGRSRGKYFIECSQNAIPNVAQIASSTSDVSTYHVGSVRRGRVSKAIVNPVPIQPSPR